MLGEVSNRHRCLMCGKEWTVQEPAVQHYFLCRDCTGRWLFEYFRSFKVRIADWLRRRTN
jgi:DNA-directed RNA polymerase subunit RPC12/RpoP